MPQPYLKYEFLFPPRPENSVPRSYIEKPENTLGFLGQPKLQGSCNGIALNGKNGRCTQIIADWNRRQEQFDAYHLNIEELKKLYRGNGWMMLYGEYMNKNQYDEKGKQWNHKYVIWDILVHNGQYLVGTTTEERYKLYRSLYCPQGEVHDKPYLTKVTENTYSVIAVRRDFGKVWDTITGYAQRSGHKASEGIYEGMVFKLKNAKLERGYNPDNNTKWQYKCRVSRTNSYSF
jgi:hypothetical protein